MILNYLKLKLNEIAEDIEGTCTLYHSRIFGYEKALQKVGVARAHF